jgi:hypothetical protein
VGWNEEELKKDDEVRGLAWQVCGQKKYGLKAGTRKMGEGKGTFCRDKER